MTGFIKLGEYTEITGIENPASCIPAVSPEVLENFRKTAASLKKIAPKAEDFLYFSAVMMHAAEAAAINDDGTPKLTAQGETVQVGWDKTGGTWKWITNDQGVKPYKNSNGDIFPEEELVKAHKKWVHKPLCVDHKSSSVEHVRGFIVDTYYDRALKRVIALCALDKASYPQLARQISTGVSNCVSMGTAVGRAICTETGCHRVAKIESDFCDHMRRKTCYGEINVDLNPIELSIVVNGADPKANIKHIIASANALNSYVENKSKELKKIAGAYRANLSYTGDKEDGEANYTAKNIEVTGDTLEEFKAAVERSMQELQNISSELSNNTNNETSNYTDDAESSSNSEISASNKEASSNDSIEELKKVTASIASTLNQMKQNLEILSKSTYKEENMAGSSDMNKKGYYQGTEEPTPGQAKYNRDSTNDKDWREWEKANANVGSTNGVYPEDLEKKRMLARAEAEERAQRRNAIVNLAKQALEDKKAYYSASEPGTKPKYPVDKLNEKVRDAEKANGDTGPVDGMFPGDEKKKELLNRASLRAQFVKASKDGSTDLSKSAWKVYLGDDLILQASVDDLSGGRGELMYDSIATREFGSKLIEKIKVQGADKVRSLIKGAQAAPGAPVVENTPATPADAGSPPADAGAPPADLENPGATDTADPNASGDPQEVVDGLVQTITDATSDLKEAVNALTGEQKEMGGDMADPAATTTTASDALSTSNLNNIRKELNVNLTGAIKEAVATLNDHKDELEYISTFYNKGTVTAQNKEFANSVVKDAVEDAKAALADSSRLLTAFVKYARGTTAIVKRAQMEQELEELTTDPFGSDSEDAALDALINSTNAELDGVSENMVDDNELKATKEELDKIQLDPGAEVEVKLASMKTREDRARLRAKLAAEATGKEDNGEVRDMSKQKFSDMLDEAHRHTSGDIENEIKVSDDLDYVEDIADINKRMMEVANAPVKVRKEAEAIDKLVKEGELDPADLDELVAQGLDKDAVSYWKKYFSQADGGSEFASELVKEHVKAQMENDLKLYKLKLARAYELAYDMAERGMCADDRPSISSQVEELMNFSDDNFDSLKRVVARNAPIMQRTAGRMPQVGVIGSGEVNTSSEENLVDQLSAALSKTAKRMF